jgi:hypothetical protein
MDNKIQTPRFANIISAIQTELTKQVEFFGTLLVLDDYERLTTIIVSNAAKYHLKVKPAPMKLGNNINDWKLRLEMALGYVKAYQELEDSGVDAQIGVDRIS